jgi:hypothetical protein
VRALLSALAVAMLVAGQVDAADEKKAAKKGRERIPQKLGLLVLGQPWPKEYLAVPGDTESTAQYARKAAAREMWLALAPGMPDAVEGATIGIYKGGVAEVRFSLRRDVEFAAVHRYFAGRFGKGARANVRVPVSASASKDCPPFYLMQEWSDRNNTLSIDSPAGLSSMHVSLVGPLAREQEEANKDETPDHEPCL